jgi:hypothetical protein
MLSIRKHRIFGIALFDLILGAIGMIIIFLISRYIFFPQLNYSVFILFGLLLTIPTGILFHILFGINTQLNYNLGLSNKPL